MSLFRVMVHEYDHPEPYGTGKLINTDTYTYSDPDQAIEEAERDREMFTSLSSLRRSSRFVVRLGDECFAEVGL